MHCETGNGAAAPAAVSIVGAVAVLLEAIFFLGLHALGQMSLEKLGGAMLILAMLATMCWSSLHAMVRPPSGKTHPTATAKASSLRMTTRLMGWFAALAALFGAATAVLATVV